MKQGNIFNQIQVTKPGRNTFNLSHDHKLSLQMGKLYPVLCMEALPSDSFNIRNDALIRFAPMLAPVMHKIDVYFHYFFVPNRIIWPNFEKWLSEQDNENYQPPFVVSTIAQNVAVNKGGIADYMGLPITDKLTEPISAIPFAAYYRIFQEYYQDQNNDPNFEKEPVQLDDGLQDLTFANAVINNVFNRAWEHDYFTSALPFAQKGVAVNIPLSLTGSADISYRLPNTPQQLVASDGTAIGADVLETDTNGFMKLNDGTTVKLNVSQLQADLEDQALSGTINDLRRAMAIQKWLELNARTGTRYKELLIGHWGTAPTDERLQRPEYIGGSKQMVVISEVLQNSQTDTTPQGNMAGHAVSASSGNEFTYYCQEHGYIFCIMSVMPTTAYYQGIPRHFSRLDQFDYQWPVFNNIGEQEILNKEIYYIKDDTDHNNGTFGYIPRYSEYRYLPSRVSGDFRDSLDFWHMARKFDNKPALNSDFIYCNPTKRIFAVEEDEVDELYSHIFFNIYAKRPIALYGTPLGL